MSSTSHKEEHHGVAHIATFKSLVTIFVLLIGLTVITYLASLVNFGSLNLFVAIAIAVVKSSLVVLYFMHLRYDKPFNSVVFVGCLVFVGLFIGLALMDSIAYKTEVDRSQAPGMKDIHTPGVYKPHDNHKTEPGKTEGDTHAKPAQH
jgi:cytochrome c oxidase subunit 4